MPVKPDKEKPAKETHGPGANQMPAISVTCQNIRRVNGKGYVRWSDKSEQEFTSAPELRQTVRQAMETNEVREFLRMLALAKWLTVNPTLDNPALLSGRTITLDLDAPANLVRIT